MVWIVWTELSPESERSDRKLFQILIRTKNSSRKYNQSPEKRRYSKFRRDCFLKSTSQFRLMNIKDQAKDKVLIIDVELEKFFVFKLKFFTEKIKNHIHKMTYLFLKKVFYTNDYCYFNSWKCQSVYHQARPKWVWHPQFSTEVGLATQFGTQVCLVPPVCDWSRSGNPSTQPKSIWHHQCATQFCLIRGNVALDRLIRADFGLDSLIRAGLVRAPHPGIDIGKCLSWNLNH